MEASSLAKLPIELKLDIYELIFYRPDKIFLGRQASARHRVKDLFWTTLDKPSDFFALTVTCKQIRAEASPVFFAINRFVVSPRIWAISGHWTVLQSSVYGVDMHKCKQWLRRIGSHNSAAIRSFTVESGDWWVRKLKQPSKRWWNHSRKAEAKILHNASLRAGAVKAAIRVQYLGWPSQNSRRRSTSKSKTTCPFEGELSPQCVVVVFTMRTDDKKTARLEVQDKFQRKLKLLEGHAPHVDCWVSSHLPRPKDGLEKAYNNVVGMLQDESDSSPAIKSQG